MFVLRLGSARTVHYSLEIAPVRPELVEGGNGVIIGIFASEHWLVHLELGDGQCSNKTSAIFAAIAWCGMRMDHGNSPLLPLFSRLLFKYLCELSDILHGKTKGWIQRKGHMIHGDSIFKPAEFAQVRTNTGIVDS